MHNLGLWTHLMKNLDSVKNNMQQSHGGFVLKGSHQMWSIMGMDGALAFYLWSDRGAIGLRVWDVTWSSLDTFKLKLSKSRHTKNKKKLRLGFPWFVSPRIKPRTKLDQSTYERQIVKLKRRISKRLPTTPFVEIPWGLDFLRLSFTKATCTSHGRHRWIIEEEAFWE